ncbi:V-type ATP synthase subunit E [uncultured archaeon]|nr:V-type ATP synthase subunit E [uncultured archaeon]
MLKEIKGTILKDAKSDGEAALRKAEDDLEAELAKVKGEGEARVAAAEREAAELVGNERRERLSWAKLEGKRVIAEAKEDAVRNAFDSLIDRVKAYAGTRQYAEKMKAKISSAAREVGGKAVIHVRKGEKAISGNGAEVRKDADIIGGAIVESKDGKLRIDLSLEALLDAERDTLRKAVYERMFK